MPTMNIDTGNYDNSLPYYNEVVKNGIALSKQTFTLTKHYFFNTDMKTILSSELAKECSSKIYKKMEETEEYFLDCETKEGFGELLYYYFRENPEFNTDPLKEFVSKMANLTVLVEYFTFLFTLEEKSLISTKDVKEKMINNLALSIIEMKTPLFSMEPFGDTISIDDLSHKANFNPLSIPYDHIQGNIQQEEYSETNQRYLRQTFLMLNVLCIRWGMKPNISRSRFSQVALYGDHDFRIQPVNYDDEFFYMSLSKMPLLTAIHHFSNILTHIVESESFGEDIVISGIPFKKDFLKSLDQESLLEHYQFNSSKLLRSKKQLMSVVDICMRRLTEVNLSKTRGIKPKITHFIRELFLPTFQNDNKSDVNYGGLFTIYSSFGKGRREVFLGPSNADHPWFYDNRLFERMYQYFQDDEVLPSKVNFMHDLNLEEFWEDFEIDSSFYHSESTLPYDPHRSYTSEEKRQIQFIYHNLDYLTETENLFFEAYQFTNMKDPSV